MRSESRSLSLLRCQGLSTEYCLLGHSSAPRSSEIISMKNFLCLLGENEGRRDSIILSGHTSLLSSFSWKPSKHSVSHLPLGPCPQTHSTRCLPLSRPLLHRCVIDGSWDTKTLIDSSLISSNQNSNASPSLLS